MSFSSRGIALAGRDGTGSIGSQHSSPVNRVAQDLHPPSHVAQSPTRSACQSQSDTRPIAASVTSGQREPTRSYVHGTVRDQLATVDSVHSVRSVRQDTAELASYFLADKSDAQSSLFFSRPPWPQSSFSDTAPSLLKDHDDSEDVGSGTTASRARTVAQVPYLASAEKRNAGAGVNRESYDSEDGPSILATMLRRSPPKDNGDYKGLKLDQALEEAREDGEGEAEAEVEADGDELCEALATDGQSKADRWTDYDRNGKATESAPLLQDSPVRGWRAGYGSVTGARRDQDLESQKLRGRKRWMSGMAKSAGRATARLQRVATGVRSAKVRDASALWQKLFGAPLGCLPAVVVGLLLNILDALSYGMILFPLGNPIFANLGSAGISIFYVSTIISQLTFSTGSIFRGGVGSELIEVVPFFHSMAATITDLVGEENADAVIATTITSYALSSMMTGLVFYVMGRFKFGYIVGFIPRHILIGCIGGVGWFLVATGFEVSARMEGSLNYDLDSLKRLGQPDTVPLWITPFVLALVLFCGQTRITSKYFLPLYILTIPLVFYMFLFMVDALRLDTLRDKGWIFLGPPAGEPWWYFYTLYKLSIVRWSAILQCVPAMLALTFFGILHVPINVPALAQNTGEDHADLNHELKLHGCSNFLSGMAGSIQNYLVYANTLLFMRSGGDSRLAGFELAALTFGVMTIGPSLIGFIPIMMVGVLIFDLGFELLLEAVWQPRKKLQKLEYLTVIVIVLVMGIYDFVVGIFVGILLAFVSLIIQASRVSAVRGSYSGEVVGSTVRRNPSQQHYLKQVGQQIFVIKLAGYLFFGTIVSVEDKIRALIADEAFERRPIKFLVIDMWQVTGLDYSAGEAFNTISRLLRRKGVELVLSGIDPSSALGRDLRAVGLGDDGVDVPFLPDLNSALEGCENELLKTFYASQEAARTRMRNVPPATSLDVMAPSGHDSTGPGQRLHKRRQGLQEQDSEQSREALVQPQQHATTADLYSTSPRRSHLHEAARKSLGDDQVSQLTRWQSFKEPLRLLLQIFQDLSSRNEDFWFRAVPYFTRHEFSSGTILFKQGEAASAFYLVERGILRAEYDLPQGWLCESIVAGTTCGELPFFSETARTATAVVERECVVWRMDRRGWEAVQREEADVARELLRMSLKLTSERMGVITQYILTMAD